MIHLIIRIIIKSVTSPEFWIKCYCALFCSDLLLSPFYSFVWFLVCSIFVRTNIYRKYVRPAAKDYDVLVCYIIFSHFIILVNRKITMPTALRKNESNQLHNSKKKHFFVQHSSHNMFCRQLLRWWKIELKQKQIEQKIKYRKKSGKTIDWNEF